MDSGVERVAPHITHVSTTMHISHFLPSIFLILYSLVSCVFSCKQFLYIYKISPDNSYFIITEKTTT